VGNQPWPRSCRFVLVYQSGHWQEVPCKSLKGHKGGMYYHVLPPEEPPLILLPTLR
jgi:hypothetical protein